MKALKKHIPIEDFSYLRGPYSWIIVSLVLIITLFYYLLQFFRLAVFEFLPFAQSLLIFEYLHRMIGILLYIPLISAVLFLWWRGALVVWFLSVALISPRLVYIYNGDFAWIINNLFYLSFPVLIALFIIVELKWRRKQKQIEIDKEKERQNYLAQVFKAQEDERKRLAQEIHDDSIQRLTAIAINARLLTCNEYKLPELKDKIAALGDKVISVSEDLRRMTLDLRPTVLDDLGLLSAIRWLVNVFQEESGINTCLEIEGEDNRITAKHSINIFRIIQEALNNIKQHSKATKVNIKVQIAENRIMVSIQDNGQGFSPPVRNGELTARGKLGLIGMQQRVQFLNGTFHLQSEIDKGTRIYFESMI
jgi:two-component system, NarL family, sensor histidine kinase DegS